MTGARHAKTPADAVRDAEVVITCFPESHNVQALLDGPDGLSSAMIRGATLTRISPSSILELGRRGQPRLHRACPEVSPLPQSYLAQFGAPSRR